MGAMGLHFAAHCRSFLVVFILKPLDEAFDTMDVTYLRYQDDILSQVVGKNSTELEFSRVIGMVCWEPNPALAFATGVTL